jgi:prophage regulatory protein
MNHDTTPKIDRLLRLPEVVAICKRSRTSIYYDVRAGRFPKPVRIGPRAIAWRESDIQRWISEGAAGVAQ